MTATLPVGDVNASTASPVYSQTRGRRLCAPDETYCVFSQRQDRPLGREQKAVR